MAGLRLGVNIDHVATLRQARYAAMPESQNAEPDPIADGFSCREQIRQTTNRRTLHIAQVMQMAIEHGARGPAGNFPEAHAIAPAPAIPSRRAALQVLGVGCGVVLLVRARLLSRTKKPRP